MNRSFSSSKIRESRNGRNQAHRSLCTTKPTVRIFNLDSIRLLIFVYFDLEMILTTSFFTLNPPTLQHAVRFANYNSACFFKSAKRAFSAARWAGMRHVAAQLASSKFDASGAAR